MIKVLIIEDNYDIRETTTEILELNNYSVFSASNGREGIDVAITKRPDIVLCDIVMPGIDGYTVLHIFSQNPNLKEIPFIFLTAKSERNELRKGMEMGADDYLTKPFHESELITTIEKRLNRRKLILSQFKTEERTPQNSNESSNDLNIADIFEDKKAFTFRKKQIIYLEGNEPLRLYFIKSGRVKLYKTNLEGKEFINGVCNQGECFGHLAIFKNVDYEETAEALEYSQIVSISKKEFVELLSINHNITNLFIKLMANTLLEKDSHLLSMAYSSLRRRVADGLLFLQEKHFTRQSKDTSIRLSRDELASIIGTATESLIRILSEYKADNLIEISGNEIMVINTERLKNLTL